MMNLQFRSLSTIEKSKYDTMALMDKEHCTKDLETHTEKGNDRPKKRWNDPNKPKRGKNSYLFFFEEIRSRMKEKNPDVSIRELVSYLKIFSLKSLYWL